MPGDLALPAARPSRASSSTSSSSQARQMSSARYSICAASRSRAEVCSASSGRSSGDGIVAEAELAEQRAVDDEVGVAADRRGEVAVRRAREAGVAEVPWVVARLLERAQDERRERLARRGPTWRRTSATRAEISPASAAADCGESVLGRRRRRHVEVGELREQELDRLRVGLLVDAVERARGCGRRGTRRRARSRGSSAPRRACARAARPRATPRRRDRRRSGTRPRASRSEAHRARSGGAAAREATSSASSSCSRISGDASRRCGLAVGQARVRADHRAVERRLAARRDLDGDGQPVLVRPQRAGVVGELGRQHRRDEARHVGRERPLGGALVERASRPGRSTRRRRCAPTRGSRPARGGTRARRRSPSPCPGRS